MTARPWRIPVEDVRRTIICDWTEKQLQEHILALAKPLGWLAYHTYDSRRSAPGFPDVVLVHAKQRRTIFWELKRQKGKASPAQTIWLATLTPAGQTARIVRPSDYADGTVENELRGLPIA